MPLSHVFPPVLSRDDLPRRVLVLVAHPDDEIIAIGGLLAFHGQRGDEVMVLHATPGAEGDPEGRFRDLPALRLAEVTRALAGLGIQAPTSLGFQDGNLASLEKELRKVLRERFRQHAPDLLYVFHPGEFHSDHRALALAACEARETLPEGCRIHLIGVNQVPPFASLYDYSDLLEAKKGALACFETQLSYIDFASKVMQRDQAATVNIEIQSITHCEQVLPCTSSLWPEIVKNSQDALALGNASSAGDNVARGGEGGRE